MLQANRFISVVTRDTKERLLSAQSNLRPIARLEAHHGAVVAVQTALADLNRGYLMGAEIDGYFGSRTFQAVETFQRDYGLVADGIVGRQVLTQLDALYSGEIVAPPKGVSIHFGVDRVDSLHYGDPMTLASCENDAKAMQDIATGLGYDSTLLTNEEATTGNFCNFMRSCASKLFAGDRLLISFSGHGSQVENLSGDNEPDLLDETLCFFDRMLVDDEFYSMLGDVREGVRVHVVFDSCHSGTAVKQLLLVSEDNSKQQAQRYRKGVEVLMLKTLPFTGMSDTKEDEVSKSGIPIKRDALSKALDGERPELVDPFKANAELSKEVSTLFADIFKQLTFGAAKFVDGSQAYDQNKKLYDTIKDFVGSKEDVILPCTVTSISACADPQTTPAGNPLSLFTYNLVQTWDNGNFAGSYSDFHRAVLGRSPPDSTPQLNAYGSFGSEARLRERPFAI